MTPQDKAWQLESEGRCIICGDKAKARKRGLCSMHYERYRKERATMDKDEVELFDAMLIEQGRLLPSAQGRARTQQNEFSETAAAACSGGGDAGRKRPEPYQRVNGLGGGQPPIAPASPVQPPGPPPAKPPTKPPKKPI